MRGNRGSNKHQGRKRWKVLMKGFANILLFHDDQILDLTQLNRLYLYLFKHKLYSQNRKNKRMQKPNMLSTEI